MISVVQLVGFNPVPTKRLKSLKYADNTVALIETVSAFVAKSCIGLLNLITEGARTLKARYKFNLPAPLLISQPDSSISSAVDFKICLTSSLV